MNTYPITVNTIASQTSTALTLNGQTTIILQCAGTSYATVTTAGVNTNTINALTSTSLTLNAKDATGAVTFQNNGNTHMTIGSDLISSVYYPFFNISTYYNFKIGSTSYMTLGSNGMSLTGSASILYTGTVSNASGSLILNAPTGNNVNLSINGSNIAIVTASGLYVNGATSVCNGNYFQGADSQSTIVFPYSTTKSTFIQNFNTAYGKLILSGGNWNSGNYNVFTSVSSRIGSTAGLALWGGGGDCGIVALAPGSAWQPMAIAAGTVTMHYYGALSTTLTASGFSPASDRRYKTNIKPLKTDKSLKRVLALRPCTYNRLFAKSETPIPQEVIEMNHIGFIAQEVQETNPHCIHEVDENNEKRLTLQYQDYIIHLCGGMQEQQKQIEQQQNTIQAMAKHITTLTDTINKLLEKYPL
jgi:hypothetical protein